MARQTFYQPSPRRREDDDYANETQAWSPTRTPGRSSGVSKSAGRTIGNIDNLLDEPKAAPSLADAEANPTGPQMSEPTQKEASTLDDTIGKGYTGKREVKAKKGWWNKKRAGVAGGVVGGVSVVGLLLGSVATGPLQIFHLSETLQHAFSRQQSDTDKSEQHWMRSLRSVAKGDYRYTRVGLVGSKMATSLLSDFEKSGIKFSGSDVIGHPETVQFDQGEFAKATGDENINSMTQEEFRAHIKDAYGIELDKTNTADLTGLKTQAVGKLIKNLRGSIGQDGLLGWLKGRSLNKFFGIKSIFHPINTAATNTLRKTMSPEAAYENTANEDLQAPAEETAAATEEIKGAASGVADKVANWTTIGQGVVYGLGCTMKAGGKAIVTIDRLGTVMPSIIEATKLVGLEGQMKSGDITMEDVGGVVTSLTATEQSDKENGTHDAGTTVWDGGALGVLAGTTTPDKNGNVPNDISTDHQGAFNPPNASNIETAGNRMAIAALGPGNLITYPLASGNPCGIVGALTLAGEGIATQIGLAFLAIPTGGADEVAAQSVSTAIRLGLQNAVKGMVSKFSVGFAVGDAYAMEKIQHIIVSSNAAKALGASAFRGAQGGDLLAYGARASANLISASSGGIALAGTASKTLLGSAGQEEQQQFRQENFFARMFDINDSRSLLGHLSMDMSPSFSANIASLTNGMLGIGTSILHSLASIFTHNTFADTASDSYSGNYDWGFPQFGIPDNIINADDPAANAEALGQYLTQRCPGGPGDGECGSNGTYGGYTARIRACFGNDLTQTGGLWDVSPAQAPDPSQPIDVDPGSDSYRNAHCDNDGNITVCASTNDTTPGCIWGRIILFVNDMGTLKSMACISDNTSCSDIGAPTSANTSSSNTGTSGSS